MARPSITTTGQLREFLTEKMVEVSSGGIDREDAETLVRLAREVNESFNSEVKVARSRHDLANQRPPGQGKLKIGEVEEP